MLSSASWLSFPLLAALALISLWLESRLAPSRVEACLEQELGLKVVVSCP